ncbi:glycosyltransferase [Rhizobium sp. CRRU65]|uniref:glycosyltransferase n=1 Tax=Rhizobium sp. CRRU65 TaxID=3399566 RepID=UPI003AF73D7F
MAMEQDEGLAVFNWSRRWTPMEWTARWVPAELQRHAGVDGPKMVTLSDWADTHCLVLLGDAGLGKTHEIDRLASRLRTDGVAVDLLRGRDPDLPAALDALLSSPHHAAWSGDQKAWYIFIDGLDEITPSTDAARLLSGFLDRLFATHRDTDRLRLIVTCRTSAWGEAFDRVLEDRWPVSNLRKLVLAPLDRVDIEEAIAQSERDPIKQAHLEEQLLAPQLRTLAGLPLFLHLLLMRHRSGAPLPNGPAHLLPFAIEGALADPSVDEVERRLRTVGRMAAASLLSDQPRLMLKAGQGATDALAVSRIAGGTEAVSGGSFVVTPARMARCLQSSLFTEVAPDVFEWSHRIVSDFLAARYLAEHQLSAEQILSLLTIQEVGGPGGVQPRLLEMAGWAATMIPTFFDALLERQPDALLRAQATMLKPEQRARLADALLLRFGRGDLLEQYEQLEPLLGRLDHPGLAEQLRPIITDTEAAPFRRRAAIDMAVAAQLETLADTLLDVTLDTGGDAVLRSIALRAGLQLDPMQAKERLKPLLAGDLLGDEEDRLRGALLDLYWPDQLSFRELLGVLTIPKRRDFIGHYQLFLYRFVTPDLTPDMALDALTWLHQRFDVDGRDHYQLLPVMQRVFWAAATQTAVSGVRNAMAELVDDVGHELGELTTRQNKDIVPWPEGSEVRVDIVQAILERASEPARAIAVVFLYLPDLVRPADIGMFVSRLPGVDERICGAWAQIIVDLGLNLPINMLTPVWQMASRVPQLKTLLAERYTVDIASPAADRMRRKWRREVEEQQRAAEEEDAETSWLATVVDLLDRIEAGDAGLWWQLNLQLFYEPVGGYHSNLEFIADLTRTPGWKALNDQDHHRILRTAELYLRDAPLADSAWLGTITSHRPANAGLRALFLLHQHAPAVLAQLPAETWAAWAPATIGFFSNDFYDDGDVQRELVAETYRVAPSAIHDAVRQIALGGQSEGLNQRVFELLDSVFDAPLAELLENLRQADGLKGKNARADILTFLVRHSDARATDRVQTALSRREQQTLPSSSDGGELVTAAVEMLFARPGEHWNMLLDLRESNPTLASAVWAGIAQAFAFSRALSLEELSEYELAQTYIDLAILLPERPPETSGARVLGVPDHIAQLSSAVLARLVNVGTNAGLEQLYRIQRALPHVADSLQWSIGTARQNVRSKTVRREDPAEVLSRIADMSMALTGSVPEPAAGSRRDAPSALPVPTGIDVPTPALQPSGPLDPASHRVILLVATEWSSSHGGISTLNRDLCVALAALGHRILCLVVEASEAEQNDARAKSVTLIRARESVGIRGRERLLLCEREDLEKAPDIVIGHDHITGRYARAIAGRFGAKYVHILHTIPQENEALKDSRDGIERDLLAGEIKLEDQISLGQQSDLIVAVGPRIERHFRAEAYNIPDVVVMVPGLNTELLKVTVNHLSLRLNSCLMSGRMEDAGVKGGRLACDVIKQVAQLRQWPTGDTPQLSIRGFSKEKADAEFARIGFAKDYAQFVRFRSYSTNPDELRQDYLKSALIIMPSVAEGFGLTGLEAISVGVPVVLSSESGLAHYLLASELNDGLDQALVEPSIAPVTLCDQDNLAAWVEKVDAILSDRAAAFRRAAELRDALKARLNWDIVARRLSKDLERLH